MPRFFFETDDGDAYWGDADGLELASEDLARLEAIRLLPDMARDAMLEDGKRTLISSVRNEDGNLIYTATLTLTGEWHKASAWPVKKP